MTTMTLDWAALTEGERGTIFEYAVARLKGLDEPPPLDDGVPFRPDPRWLTLTAEQREAVIAVEIAELERAGLAAQFTNQRARAAANARPALIGAMKQLWQAVLGLRGHVDEFAASRGQVFVETDEPVAADGPVYAAPTPWATHDVDTKLEPGDAHGDTRIERRRRATELERLIRDAKKQYARSGPVARARLDLELQEWSSELAAIREAERAERGEYRKI